jgi:hypothetical protein
MVLIFVDCPKQNKSNQIKSNEKDIQHLRTAPHLGAPIRPVRKMPSQHVI